MPADTEKCRICGLHIDSLTGLHNRARWDVIINHYEKFRDEENVAIFFFDINGLKEINDTKGHAAGDAYIVRVAQTIKRSFRSTDYLVARIGGDEFAVIIPGMFAFPAAERTQSIEAAFQKEGLSVSIGEASGSSKAIRDVVHQADTRMYLAKKGIYMRKPVPQFSMDIAEYILMLQEYKDLVHDDVLISELIFSTYPQLRPVKA